MKVFVIIPAAGLGTRMSAGAKKGPRPSKQFTELGGTPILIHTLRKFAVCNQVNEICVALRKNEMEAFRRQLEHEGLKKPVQMVEGGEHRQESVANALRGIVANDDDIVLVHDAVRPFVEVETIQAVIAAVKKSGAAIAGVHLGENAAGFLVVKQQVIRPAHIALRSSYLEDGLSGGYSRS